ncbi:hypothetical protein RF11_08936 [Thelohanellus kitauei]|uniref:Uncharacterized protein n=1 Tax=Thelohanellus kitauei TaxID=669202 RepID=A0A0C2M6V4_THEKT|nr:hypothetical protein RF11_08936 [Thelohanellus kitauei]
MRNFEYNTPYSNQAKDFNPVQLYSWRVTKMKLENAYTDIPCDTLTDRASLGTQIARVFVSSWTSMVLSSSLDLDMASEYDSLNHTGSEMFSNTEFEPQKLIGNYFFNICN